MNTVALLLLNLWASIELMYASLMPHKAYTVKFTSLRSGAVRFSNHGPGTFMRTRSSACSLAECCV